MKRNILLSLLALSLLAGCAELTSLRNKGVNLAVSVGTNTLGLLDFGTPLVQDPAQLDDTNAVVVNPAIVSAAQGAATTFGGPYGVPIAAGIGVIAGIAGVIATQSRRRKSEK